MPPEDGPQLTDLGVGIMLVLMLLAMLIVGYGFTLFTMAGR